MKAGLAVLIVSLAIGVWWFNKSPPVVVQGIEVRLGSVYKHVTNTRSGTVEACRRAKLSVPVGGQIDAIHVTEGDKVKAGELLLTLFQKDIQAQIKQAEATIVSAQYQSKRQCALSSLDTLEATRFASLVEDGSASKEQFDLITYKAKASSMGCAASHADIVHAETTIELLTAQLSKTELRAPFNGTIAEINGEVGEFATPSPPGIPTLPMVDLIDTQCFYVKAPIDEVDAGQMQIGQDVEIHLDAYRDMPLKGKVKRISPYVFAMEKQARTVDVEVSINDYSLNLLVGYSADVEIQIDHHTDVLTIPTRAIFSNNLVFVAKDGLLVQRTVMVGLSNWQTSEVRSGLSEGDIIVVASDNVELIEGMEVSVVIEQDAL